VKSRAGALAGKILVSGVCIGILAARYGKDASLRQSLARLDPGAFLLALGLLGVGLAISALRWRILLAAAGAQLGWGRAVHLYFMGYFFNVVLPTSVGGDVLRALALRGKVSTATAWGSILVERLLGFGCLLLLGIAASFAAPRAAAARHVLLIAAAVYLVGLVLILRGHIPDPTGNGILAKGLRSILRLRGEIRSYGPHGKAMAAGVALSLLWQGVLIAVNAVLSRGMGGNIPLASLLVLVPLVQALTMIPVSLGGLGVREMGYEHFFRISGFDPAEGVALGLAWLAVSTLFALLGGATLLLRPIPVEGRASEGRA
jgi:uncharacterized protein (TIRG00374 family)